MTLSAKPPAQLERFAWVTHGERVGPDPVFDTDLANYIDAAILPTRGAFLAEWLLIVPRIQSLSTAELTAEQRASILRIAAEVCDQLRAKTGASVIFEHGAGRRGSLAGCGVDQAHLHAIGGVEDALERLLSRLTDLDWSVVDYSDPWARTPLGCDYLMIRDGTRAVWAHFPNPTSQRIRKALADIIGVRDQWDYRSCPNLENVLRTKELFSGAFARADI